MPRPDDTKIAQAAHQIWLDENQSEGRDEEHWHRAKLALTGKSTRKRAPKAAPIASGKPAATKTRATSKSKLPGQSSVACTQAAGIRRSTISAHQLQPAGIASSLKLYSG
ncbi:DUF2934 domain-containing protein [Puniceibacterium sediminis]|uniref:DUF2934 domain-containing protein n=1 Tax=Puniceibacterium sediminis TaxID=1608407 RepID=A0A238XQU7_9RHOB|nr:Protein of unknown function [Puniceibacterium sediminis]